MSSFSRKLTVAIGEDARPVGMLFFEARGGKETSSFRYNEEWLGAPASFALSPSLPLLPSPFFASKTGADGLHARSLPGVIADTSPDAWGRKILAHDTKKLGRPMTDLDFLVGVDDATRMGALRFLDEKGTPLRPHGDGRPIVPPIFSLPQLQAAARRFEKNDISDEDLQRLLVPGSSLGGARPKACVAGDDGKLYIAKFTSERDQNQAIELAEVMTLTLAGHVGISAPPARVISVANFPVALIERFDRIAGHRAHYISAQTFLDAHNAEDGTYVDMAESLRAYSAAPKEQLAELFRRIAFSMLVSNSDDHLKNHGFLMVAGGKWMFSPVFDVNPQPDRHHSLKTPLDHTNGPDAGIDELIDLAPSFDLARDEGRALISGMAKTISSTWKSVGESVGMSPEDIRSYQAAFSHKNMEQASMSCRCSRPGRRRSRLPLSIRQRRR